MLLIFIIHFLVKKFNLEIILLLFTIKYIDDNDEFKGLLLAKNILTNIIFILGY